MREQRVKEEVDSVYQREIESMRGRQRESITNEAGRRSEIGSGCSAYLVMSSVSWDGSGG